jgi:hypothetical protein
MTSEDALMRAMCVRDCRGSNDEDGGGLEAVLARYQALRRSRYWQVAALGRQRNRGLRGTAMGSVARHGMNRTVQWMLSGNGPRQWIEL